MKDLKSQVVKNRRENSYIKKLLLAIVAIESVVIFALATAAQVLTPTGMDSSGQYHIAKSTDTLSWPTALSQLTNDSGFLTSSSLGSYLTSANAASTYATISTVSGKQNTITTGTTAQYFRGDLSLATFPTYPRNTSALSLSLVGSGATGTQISSTKDSTVRLNVSTSTTSTIGGPSTSLVALKICSTNNATEGSWTTVATLENDQTITLAIVLNSIQVMKGQLDSDVPAGWYVKLVNSGTGTHTETFLSGQQTIYN